MECQVIQPELVAFHFGMSEDGPRSEVEGHLLTCRACLEDYLALKRELECAVETPSPHAKDRLRRAVAGVVARPAPHTLWSWWERPLAVALAGVAIGLACLVVQSLSTAPGTAPHALTRE